MAATKSFTSQTVIFVLLGLLLGRNALSLRPPGPRDDQRDRGVAGQITHVLRQSEQIRAIAEKYKNAKSMLYFGRQMQYGVALEGALKMKEITYIHAEGHPTAELKHGVIALVDENTPSVFLCPKDGVYDKNINNMQQIKARKGPVIAVATEGDEGHPQLRRRCLLYSRRARVHHAILSVVPLQLFAYHMAVIPRPRRG